jgi:pimeloyl-ACP methyl ester carboxylesterase
MATTAGFPHAWPPNPLSLLNFLSLPLSGRLNQKHVDRSFARLLLAERDMPRSRELLAGWPAALQNEPTGVAGYAAHLAAVMGHSTGWRLRRIACPTVVVTGDDDALLPHHNSRILAKLIPGAHLEVIPGGHILPAADPACVERGLDRVRRMARGPAGRSHATPIIPAPERKRSAAS